MILYVHSSIPEGFLDIFISLRLPYNTHLVDALCNAVVWPHEARQAPLVHNNQH